MENVDNLAEPAGSLSHRNAVQPSRRALRVRLRRGLAGSCGRRANIRWAREVAEAMRPFTTGSDSVNHVGLEAQEGIDRIKAAFGANYDRLVALKNKYDPTNLFRHNQNIRPTV